MRSIVALALIALLGAPLARAALPSDPVLSRGLQELVTNGLETGLGIWYAGQPKLAADMNAKVSAATKNLGYAYDTEIVAVQTISKRVTRYYVAVYFANRPLWMRIERYVGRDKTFYLPLQFSLDPDAILPGYLTDFVQ
jgi:hypothetical protein